MTWMVGGGGRISSQHTNPQRPKARVLALMAIPSELAGGENGGGGACLVQCWKLKEMP